MTYNFDIDRWYANHRAAVEARHKAGEIDDGELERQLEELDRRREEMEERLDGSFQIPPRHAG